MPDSDSDSRVPKMAQAMGRGGGGGRVVGEYLVGRQIGSGSFSVVWHARHKVHGTEVAIKEIATSRLNKKLQDSLMSEIFILKKINHPNIIHLHDIIEVRKLLLELNIFSRKFELVEERNLNFFGRKSEEFDCNIYRKKCVLHC